eukprot:6476563-Amphidinium_carterae.1
MVFHQVHDRANVWSFRKAVSAWHLASTASKSHKASGDSLPELLTWHVTCGCAAHDIHNLLKWAVVSSCGFDGDHLKAVYVAISSVKNCYAS